MKMVSTRGHKFKFTDGERVLCYEPDPTKAKVLYDSKVLQVIVTKDERGKKNIEYLIHFQGWNSSWDRCVSEDYVLKDTEENRKLQRDLAEKAQLQLGAYLYRKERKKHCPRSSEKMNEQVEHAGQRGKATSGSSLKSHEDYEGDDDEDEEDDSMMTSDDESSVDTDHSLDEKVPLELSINMMTLLDQDFEFITSQNKQVKLPANPNIVKILQDYVRHRSLSNYTNTLNSNKQRRSKKHQKAVKDDFDSIHAHVKLCQETVDGLRVCFDFTAGDILMYAEERQQYDCISNGKLYDLTNIENKIKCEVVSDDNESQNASHSTASTVENNVESTHESAHKHDVEHGETDRRRSLRSHRDNPPATSTTGNNTTTATDQPTVSTHGISKLTIRNLGALGHVSSTTPDIEKQAQHSSQHQNTAMSCSSTSSYQSIGLRSNNLGQKKNTMMMEQLKKHVSSFNIVPATYITQKPHPPSVLYGAPHLARLFVKLPHLLYSANQPEEDNQPRALTDKKMKTLLHHLNLFMTYLETHPEWFSDKHYEDCTYTDEKPIKMELES